MTCVRTEVFPPLIVCEIMNPDPLTVHGETHRKKRNLIASGDHFL